MSSGILYVVVGLAHLPISLTLTAFGFRDIMHHIRDSVVQLVEHVRGTLCDDDSIPCLRWGLVASRSRVVWPVFVVVLFRAMFVRAMRIRAMFLGAPVPACLCKLLLISHLGLTSRVALIGARGIRRVLVQRHKSA